MSLEPGGDPRWDRISQIFVEALELDAAQREDLIARSSDDAAVRDEVRALLSAFIERGARIEAPTRLDVTPEAGDCGPYRLLRVLGEGGMGTVWLAERADGLFERRVAIKRIKGGMDRDLVLRSFERERNALADLDHPSVARLLDGGVADDGRPYLVLEFVDGVPFDEACRTRGATVRDRVQLMHAVCEGVGAAHARRIVHRDLKPSNILVTSDGRPKVLDFGIAKILPAGGGVDSLLTLTGERLLTPRYAAPEQLDGGAITPATDVYALGVLLYELLAGVPPYVLEDKPVRQALEVVLDVDPPPPSRVAPPELRRALSGDLDRIVGRALAKEPGRRYPDATALAADLLRHLRGEPVAARPNTALMRVRRVLTRNRRLLGIAVTALVVVAASATVSLLIWENSRRIAREADAAASASALRNAEAELRGGRVLEAAQHLEALRDEQAAFEVRHLLARLDTSTGGFDDVWMYRGLAFTADGERLVAAAQGGIHVALFDVTGTPLVNRELCTEAGRARPLQLAIHPADGRIAVPCGDGILRELDPQDLSTLREVDVGGTPMAAAYDPTGSLLLVGQLSGEVQALRFDDLSRMTSFCAHDEGQIKLSFRADGRQLATGSWDETVRLWSVPGFELLRTIEEHSMLVSGFAWVGDGGSLVTSSMDRTLYVHDLERGVQRGPFQGLGVPFAELVADPRDDTVVVADGLGGISRLDLESLEVIARYRGCRSSPVALALDPRTGRIAVAGVDYSIRMWRSEDVEVPTARTCEFADRAFVLSTDGREAFLARPDGDARRYSLPGLVEVPFQGRSAAPFIGGGLIRGDSVFVALDEDAALVAWDASTGMRVATSRMPLTTPVTYSTVARSGHALSITQAGFHAFALGDLDGDLPQSIPLLPGSGASGNTAAALSLDGRHAAIGTGEGVFVLDADTWAVRASAPIDGAVSLAFDLTGERLAVGRNGDVRLLDARSGRELGFMTTGAAATSLAFHPSEPRLAVGLGSGPILIADTQQMRPRVEFGGHANKVGAVAFSSDGEHLVSASSDGTIRVWSATAQR